MSTTNDIVERLRKLLKQATPGPLVAVISHGRDSTDEGYSSFLVETPDHKVCVADLSCSGAPDAQVEANTHLLAELWSALPLLLAEREAMRKALEWYATPENYESIPYGSVLCERVVADGGNIARAAIASCQSNPETRP